MKPFEFFLTGTGTDVGKTVVGTALIRGARLAGHSASYWKPIQTGTAIPDMDDTERILSYEKGMQTHPSSYAYKAPMSPDQAAEKENARPPDFDRLIADSRRYRASYRDSYRMIEGAGGLYVPFNEEDENWLDYCKALRLPLVLVASSQLGTLNHCSLSIEAIHNAGLDLIAVVLSGPRHEANEKSLQRRYPEIDFLSLDEIDFDKSASDDAAKKLWLSLLEAQQKKNKQDDKELLVADKIFCWHPYTQHKTARPPLLIEQAKGQTLITNDGRELFDATCSWWANTIGHGHPEIGAAIHRQQQRLDHTIFANATHQGAINLAKRLATLTENLLPRSFFTDNGSCAVEVGLKIALQSAQNRGQDARQKFLTFKGAYHGDTFGAMRAGTSDEFHSNFTDTGERFFRLNPVTVHPSVACPKGEAALDEELESLAGFFADHHLNLAGVILEPLVQGASGMNLQSKIWLEALGNHCKSYQVPLIFDEVFTGMGRVGDYFAFQSLNITPDIVCIAKGLTGGTLPLAVTLTSEALFQDFYSDDKEKALYHGHTYTANATACAAALATLDLYEKHDYIGNCRRLSERLESWAQRHTEQGLIENARVQGAILAFEIAGSGGHDYFSDFGPRVTELGLEEGLFLRPLGNTVYLLPMLSLKREELDRALAALTNVVRRAQQL